MGASSTHLGHGLLQNKLLLLTISMVLHAGVLALLATVVVYREIREPPPLVAVSLTTPPPPPIARTRDDVLGALARHGDRVDRSALEAIEPRLRPTTVALPPSLPVDTPIHPVTGYLDLGEAKWDLVERALRGLGLPGVGRRGAFEATVYTFARIKQVREGDQWFRGKDRQRAPDKLYSYVLRVGARTEAPGSANTDRWRGLDYQASILWPETLAGTYHFRLTSDGGAVFQIDGEDVIDHDGAHGFRPLEGTAELTAGRHAFRLAYIQAPGSQLGLLLHYHRAGEQGWRLLDLRPLLMQSAVQASNPVLAETGDPEWVP